MWNLNVPIEQITKLITKIFQYLISTAFRDLHISATLTNPVSETSEPEMSRISQELSAKDMITSSDSNFLLRAIDAIAICHSMIWIETLDNTNKLFSKKSLDAKLPMNQQLKYSNNITVSHVA